MKFLHKLFPAGHFVISLLFLAGGFALIVIDGAQLWQGIHIFRETHITDRLNAVLESIAVLQNNPEYLPYVASVGLTAAAMLAAWGVFIRLNRSAEELEPEAMQAAKREDRKVEKSVKGDPAK